MPHGHLSVPIVSSVFSPTTPPQFWWWASIPGFTLDSPRVLHLEISYAISENIVLRKVGEKKMMRPDRSPAVKTQCLGCQPLVCWAQGATWHLAGVCEAGQEVLAALPGGPGLQTPRGTPFLAPLSAWSLHFLVAPPPQPLSKSCDLGALAQLATFSLDSANRPAAARSLSDPPSPSPGQGRISKGCFFSHSSLSDSFLSPAWS